MRKSSRVVIDAYGFIKVVMAFLAFIYMMLYVCHVLELNFLDFIVPLFKPFAEFTTLFFKHSVMYAGKPYDSMYLVSSIFFFLVAYLMNTNTYRIVDYLDSLEYNTTRQRIKSDIRANAALENNFKDILEEINKCVLVINFKLSVAPSISGGNKIDVEAIKKNNNNFILKSFGENPLAKLELKDGKLYFICHDIKNFDTLFMNISKLLVSVVQSNSASSVNTIPCFAVDAFEEDTLSSEQIKLIDRILACTYKNKVVTTQLFAHRYNLLEDTKFKVVTMGNVRFFDQAYTQSASDVDFFEDVDDDYMQSYVDVELYTLARKKRKAS
ncbi:hypothetical protein IJC60_02850 [bacterium]|nr:hypothetical protein [bacterium]